jgi:Ser/Thr protein kinase RdoA (MazF antagonist)
MSQAYEPGEVVRLERLARSALVHWGIEPESQVELINLSENAIFRIDPAGGADPVLLRVGRPAYSTVAEVRSELAWIDAIGRDSVVRVPPVVSAAGGEVVVELSTDELPQPRPCVAFGLVPGEALPVDGELVAPFRTLGALTARLHGQARAWQPPPDFTRRRWDFESTVGSQPIWGRWQDGMGVGPPEHDLLDRLAAELAGRLGEFGTGPERFGLVHADLRLANVLFDGDDAYVIDFDDSGWSWFMYDLAACLTFIEGREDLSDLVAAWLDGYRDVAAIDDETVAIIPTLIMLRRLLVLAWVGSHAETPLAQQEGLAYTHVTCELAERYLSGDGPGL